MPAKLIEDLSNASAKGLLHQSLSAYTRPHVLVVDEIGYLSYGPDAANVLFHVVNDRHLKKRTMIFTTNKPLSPWGKVLHDGDLAAAILDRVLERGRFIHLGGPSGRNRHLNLEEVSPAKADRLRISGTHSAEGNRYRGAHRVNRGLLLEIERRPSVFLTILLRTFHTFPYADSIPLGTRAGRDRCR